MALPTIGEKVDVDFNALRHPDYDKMFLRWKMQWDFWRGGLNVLQPDYPATAIRYGLVVEDPVGVTGTEEDPETPRRISNYEWRTGRANSYIWKHPRETRNEYEERQARQDHYPLFQSIVNIFVSGILRTGATYAGPSVIEQPWVEYHENVDLCGTNFESFIRQALSIAVSMGRCHAITDRPSSGEGAMSRFEEESRGERAYSWLVNPLDLVDWQLDLQGRLSWARVREPDDSKESHRGPSEGALSPWWQYRIWYRDSWELWRTPRENSDPLMDPTGDNGVTWTRVAAGEHGIGEVPIATLYAGKDGRPSAWDTESPLSDVADADRKLLNRQSEMDELERAQAFALLAIPEAESGPSGGVDIGPFRAFTYPSEAGAPTYINPDQTILKGKQERIADTMHIIRQLAGAGRGRAEFSKEERSAASLSLESSEKQNLMAWWAGSTQEFDIAVHRHAAKWEGLESWPVASYDRTFDLRAISSQIQDLVQLSSVAVLRPAMSDLAKPVIARILREAGVSQDKVDEAIRLVEEEAAKLDAEEPAGPVVEFGAPPGGDNASSS